MKHEILLKSLARTRHSPVNQHFTIMSSLTRSELFKEQVTSARLNQAWAPNDDSHTIMILKDYAKIERFCQRNVGHYASYWKSKYLEDREGTMQTIEAFDRNRCACVDFTIRAAGFISIFCAIAGLVRLVVLF